MIANRILEWTKSNSGYEPKRDYVGLSQVGRCLGCSSERRINGHEPSEAEALRCFEGYLAERDVLARIESAGLTVSDTGREVAVGELRGHLDGLVEIDGERLLLEVKSLGNVYQFLQIETTNRVHPAIYLQVQAYLEALRGERINRAIIVFKCRETGAIGECLIAHSQRGALRAIERGTQLLAALEENVPLPHEPFCRSDNGRP